MSLTCKVKIKRNIQDFSKQKHDKLESKIKNPKLKPKSEVKKSYSQQKMSHPLEKDTDNKGSPFLMAPKASQRYVVHD